MTFKIKFLTIRDTFKVLDLPQITPIVGGGVVVAKLVGSTVKVGEGGSYCVYMSTE